MHIIQIIESFGAGTLQIVRAIVEECHRNGWQVTVFHGHRPETPDNYRALFPDEVVLKRLKTGRAINGVLDAFDAFRIAVYARKVGARIIHGHSSKGGALARLAGLLTGCPALYTPHGFSFIGPNGADASKITFQAEKLLGRLPGEFVCCSESEATVARLLSAKVSVIRNFVDTEAVRALAAARPQTSRCDVVTAGRISVQKNVPLFMDVARRLPDLRFLWVGGPREDFDGDLPANVEITGWVDRPEAVGRIASAKVYLSTSLYEGMPVAMMEAQALGLPVVSTDVHGSRDIVRNRENGLLADDAPQIANALSRILSDPSGLLAQYSRMAFQSAEGHNRTLQLEAWMRHYRSVVQTSRPTLPRPSIAKQDAQ